MPKVVQLEVIFDAGFLNCSIMGFPHASNWLTGLAFRWKDNGAFRLFHATLQQFGHFFGHRNFPPRRLRLAKWVEDCTVAKIHVFAPNSENFLRTQSSIQNDLCYVL